MRSAIQTLPSVSVTDWSVFSLNAGADYASEWNTIAGFDWTAVNVVRVDGFLSSPSTPGNFWVGQLYFGNARYSSVQEDAASQAAFGLREYVDTDEELWSDYECSLRAKAVLSHMKDPSEYIKINSTVIDYGNTPLLPAEMIPVSLPNENVSGNFQILSVEYHVKESGELEITIPLGRSPDFSGLRFCTTLAI